MTSTTKSASTTAPTALVGGAQKSATTSLFFLLAQHPDVFASSLKEPQYFAFDGPREFVGPGADTFNKSLVSDEGEYGALFAGGEAHQHRIEASTLYLSEPGVPERVRAFDPAMKVVFILRDPADRAYSAFNFCRLRGWEPLDSVLEGIDAEDERLAAGWPPHFGYRSLSSYGDHLRRWHDVLPADQILCLSKRALEDDPEPTLRRIEDFLDVERFDGYNIGVRHNPSGTPRFARFEKLIDSQSAFKRRVREIAPDAVHRALVKVRNWNVVPPEGLAADDRAALIDLFAEQIDIVREIGGEDLVTGWDQS